MFDMVFMVCVVVWYNVVLYFDNMVCMVVFMVLDYWFVWWFVMYVGIVCMTIYLAIFIWHVRWYLC